MKNLKTRLSWSLQALIFVSSIYFIVHIFHQNYSQFLNLKVEIGILFLTALSLSFFLYIILMLLLGISWVHILQPTQKNTCLKIYLKSQALKYLPGNFFHFVYRHTETKKKTGVTHRNLVKGTMSETSGLVLFATLYTSALLIWPLQIKFLTSWLSIYVISAGLLIAIIGLIYYLRSQIIGHHFWVVVTCYASYFFVMGFICQILAYALGFESTPLLLMVAIYSAAWLIGYIAPGAPGGIGVREMVFILLGAPIILEYQALILIATVRLISITAEVLLYFIGAKLSTRVIHLWVWFDKKEL